MKAALRRAPRHLQDEAMKEVEASTRAMHREAMAGFAIAARYAAFWHGQIGMRNITGTARRFYRWSVSRRMMRGRVGLLSRTAERRAFYLRFFLYGTRNQPARPVHDDAFEGEREVYIQRQAQALQRVVRRL